MSKFNYEYLPELMVALAGLILFLVIFTASPVR